MILQCCKTHYKLQLGEKDGIELKKKKKLKKNQGFCGLVCLVALLQLESFFLLFRQKTNSMSWIWLKENIVIVRLFENSYNTQSPSMTKYFTDGVPLHATVNNQTKGLGALLAA